MLNFTYVFLQRTLLEKNSLRPVCIHMLHQFLQVSLLQLLLEEMWLRLLLGGMFQPRASRLLDIEYTETKEMDHTQMYLSMTERLSQPNICKHFIVRVRKRIFLHIYCFQRGRRKWFQSSTLGTMLKVSRSITLCSIFNKCKFYRIWLGRLTSILRSSDY